MSCPFYWWNNHYACRKTQKDVNDDTYHKYCKNYSYSDCPIYKGESSSGCFLTSACTEAKGLPDDCKELTVLRSFRDGYMKHTENGASEICAYYHFAPLIVEKIKSSAESKTIFEQIYNELVLPCVELIEDQKNEEAHKKYRAYVEMLKNKYLKNTEECDD